MKRLFLAGALLAAGLAPALAQTPPAAKPPAKPAADGRTLSLGGSGTGTGKLLLRDELRACLKQQETLATRRAEVDQQREPLEREKASLFTEQQALAAERERLDGLRRSASDLSARFKAHGERVQGWNQRAQALQDKSGPAADRERAAMETERNQLQQDQAALEAERTRLGDGAQQAVNAFNARAQALDQRVADWNRRNAEFTDRANTVNQEREQWLDSCANRRYREEDEIAIRKGE